MIMLGGLEESSFVILWSLLAPLGGVAFDRPTRAWPWFAAFVAVVLLAVILSEVVRPDGANLPDAFVRTFDVLNIIAVSLVAMLLLISFARGRDTAQARVEALLLNILPKEVAERLQAEPHTIADHFDNASILFADVVGFTQLASRLDAREVVGMLDRLFTTFDELVDRYSVEKIKTIGDCYMVAAGVPRPRSDHAHALADLALEMKDCAHTCMPASDLQLRPGRGGRNRTTQVPLRPMGQHSEHGQPHGVARDIRPDPDHAFDLGALGRGLHHGADGARRG